MASVLYIVSHTVSFHICTFGLICSCVTVLAISHKQNKTARFGAAVFTDLLHCTWDFSSHVWLRGSMFFVTCQIHVSRPDSGDFLASTSLLSPLSSSGFFFFCFHLPCSGNNKADFYLYAQMPGRSNLVGLLYISPSSLFLSFLFLPVLHVWTCVIEPYSFISHIINKV